MKFAGLAGTVGLMLVPHFADAAWLAKQRQTDPVHAAVAEVARNGCSVSNVQWDQLYAKHGGRENDGDYHILMMFQHKELTSTDGGFNVTFTGVAGCP